MVFANPAFLASQSGYALGWSGAFLIGAAAVGVSLLSPEETAAAPVVAPVQSGWQRTIAALVGFVGGATAAFILDGVASFIAVIVALLSSIPLLLDVLASRERMRRGVPVDLEEEIPARSEERRVGKGGRWCGSPVHCKDRRETQNTRIEGVKEE